MVKGKKVYLKAVSLEDTDFMVMLLNDQEVAYYEGKQEFLVNNTDQKKWLENKNSKQMNLIVYSNSDEKIGYLSFKFTNEVSRIGHIGIKLEKNFRGQGFASDALRTLCTYIFMKFNVHKLKTHIVEYNHSSLGLFEKCGWTKEGIARAEVYMNGKYYDNVQFGLLNQEFIDNMDNSQHIELINFTRK